MKRFALVLMPFLLLCITARSDGDGYITRNGKTEFPIGFYELPKDDATLHAMADAGVNLIRCANKEDLDRVHSVAVQGWVPLPLDAGATDELRARIETLKDHPALAIWEGPDEVVWNFTAYSGLFKSGVYKEKDEWWKQTPHAVEYSESKAAEIIPKMRSAVELIHSLDKKPHQVWINEAYKSDVKFVRQYLPFVNVTGCDIYPVKARDPHIENVGSATDRWQMVGNGKPVWMVLQAFSWDELGADYADRGSAYPSYAESRFMAFDAIAHGAKGILYWGSTYLKSEECRKSIYAVTKGLSELQPFLVANPEAGPRLRLIELPEESGTLGVAMSVRHVNSNWLVMLVNEDSTPHMGVEIAGLSALEGRILTIKGSTEAARVSEGQFVTRLQPHEVKAFRTEAR